MGESYGQRTRSWSTDEDFYEKEWLELCSIPTGKSPKKDSSFTISRRIALMRQV